MKGLKHRRSRNSVHRTQRYPLYAAIIIIFALIVALTILLIQKNKLDELTTTSLNEMAATVQSDVKIASRECEKISLPGSDVSGQILPNMRVHLYAAKTMNESMIVVYNFSMLDEDAYNRAQAAIDAIEKSISTGRSYSDEAAELNKAMELLGQSVDSHYADAENMLMPDTNVR